MEKKDTRVPKCKHPNKKSVFKRRELRVIRKTHGMGIKIAIHTYSVWQASTTMTKKILF